MRRFLGVLTVLMSAGCADAAEQDAVPVDVTQSPDQEPAVSLADVAGEWQMQAMPEGGDTVLVTYRLWAADDSIWTMKFDHQQETLPVQIIVVEGDSILAQIGPYSSALRPGVSVTTFTTYRLVEDTLHGRSVAHYNVSTSDSVRYIRAKGTRAAARPNPDSIS